MRKNTNMATVPEGTETYQVRLGTFTVEGTKTYQSVPGYPPVPGGEARKQGTRTYRGTLVPGTLVPLRRCARAKSNGRAIFCD
jgi:hypothetical protein